MRHLLVGGALSAFVTACTIMNGLAVPAPSEVTEQGDDDGGPGGRTDGAGDPDSNTGPTGCALKRAPKKPAADSPGGADVEVVVALKRMVSVAGTTRAGLDLDGLCSCVNDERQACKPKGTDKNCDGTDGVDNASAEGFTAIVGGTAGAVNIIEDANFRIAQGDHGDVFRIEGYNGKDDDTSVTVTWFPSPGLGQAPNFTRVQSWPVGTPVSATSAWVANRTLVANFESIEVFFLDDTPAPTASMAAAILTGPIVDVDGKPTLGTSVLAGRVNTTSLLKGVGQLAPQSVGGVALCNFPPYGGIASAMCSKADLPGSPADDGLDKPCDSISMALTLELTPATVGGTQAVPKPGDRCGGATSISCD